MTLGPVLVGKVVAVRRGGTTRNGNPWYAVDVETESGGIVETRTAADAMIGYAIDSSEFLGKKHRFALTSRGQIAWAID